MVKLSRSEIDKRQHIKRPWINSYKCAKQRCENPNNPRYKDYGGRRIQFLLSKEEIEELWFRNKAWLLKQPSLDREDNDGHYELSNCRFIEFDINRVKDRYKPILQYDLNNNFIREWRSITEASKKLNLDKSNMTKVLNNKINTLGGFKWRYKYAN